MKIYEEKQKNKKSWSIKLNTESKSLIAVDNDTGKEICEIILFKSHGLTISKNHLKECLLKEGYDPFEHNDSFSEHGSLIIDNAQM